MRNKVIAKKDGNIEIMDKTSEITNSVRRLQQLCWDCKNGFPSKCKKICDIHKLRIENYDFIDSGYQVFDRDGYIFLFIVSKCSNFEQGEVCHYKKNMTRLKRK